MLAGFSAQNAFHVSLFSVSHTPTPIHLVNKLLFIILASVKTAGSVKSLQLLRWCTAVLVGAPCALYGQVQLLELPPQPLRSTVPVLWGPVVELVLCQVDWRVLCFRFVLVVSGYC